MKETRAEHLAVEKLRPFEGHPFKVVDNEEMDQLTWSILTQGLLTPLVVRPLDNGDYEVISGHRRLHACKKAGIETVPALIYAIDRDAAAIALVDSNLHRESILPSEKAFAYKMKMDALSRQGKRTDLTSRQLGKKWSVTQLSEAGNDSERQIHRYIRLTHLIPGILQMVDEGKIALTPAVELSFLTDTEQEDLLETMESEDCTPSLSQAQQMKLLSQRGELTMDGIFKLLCQPKANQKEKVSFFRDDIRSFFPPHYTTARMQSTIVELLKGYQRSWQRRDRDER